MFWMGSGLLTKQHTYYNDLKNTMYYMYYAHLFLKHANICQDIYGCLYLSFDVLFWLDTLYNKTKFRMVLMDASSPITTIATVIKSYFVRWSAFNCISSLRIPSATQLQTCSFFILSVPLQLPVIWLHEQPSSH